MHEPFECEATARRIGSSNPDAMLPCPVCATSLKGKNLNSHLGRVHAGQSAGSKRWRGTDRALIRPLLGLFVLSAAQLPLLGVVPTVHVRWMLWVMIAELTVFLGGLALTVFRKLPAELVLDNDRLIVRYGLGLLSRSVSLDAASVEVGTLVEARSRTHAQGISDNATDDFEVGSYLRVRGGDGTLTLGSKTGTRLRKHWAPDGWASAARARFWDITLEPAALVAVEYLLVHRGILAPR